MARQKASKEENHGPFPDEVQTPKVEPQIKLRNQMVQHHHLFKALLKTMLKNVTPWMKGRPTFKDVEHVHFYHSIDSFGNPQTHTSEVGGHFHKVEWSTDENGHFVAKCGPPLRRISKRGRDGYPKNHIIPVRYPQVPDDETQPSEIFDQHIHEMRYEGSDEISTAKIQQLYNDGAKKMQALQPKMPKTDEATIVDNDRG